MSGATTTRPILSRLLKAVRGWEVQAVAVWRLDGLGRSLAHLLQPLQEFESNDFRILIHDAVIDTSIHFRIRSTTV